MEKMEEEVEKIKYQATLNTILSPYVILSGKCEKIFTEKNKTK